jgi:hypothetical protein
MKRLMLLSKDVEKLCHHLRELGCTEDQIERHVVLKGRHKQGCLESTSTPRVPHFQGSQVVFAAKWGDEFSAKTY